MNIRVDFTKTVRDMKPVHGVGQPPFVGTDFSMIQYLKKARIPFSRLHDVGGPYGGFRWVDIPNIFRDFNADPTKEESYDFVFTDMLISELIKNGVEPFFRLGVTIENAASIKAYRVFPPSDNEKWAKVCEMIIRHYTEGWANGFRYNIRYWEIWNEPDCFPEPELNPMWQGTMEQYFELYRVTSKHLKSCFPHLKIGGYASCGFCDLMKHYVASANTSPRTEYFITFFEEFLKFAKENDCPLDFFSWHSYDGIESVKIYARYCREMLDKAGFTATETSFNEWNPDINLRGTNRHASIVCGMLLALQDLPVDTAMYYDARLGPSAYGGMFDPMTYAPLPAYHAFKEFSKLFELKKQVYLENEADKGVYAVAARDGGTGRILIANTTGEAVPLDIECLGRVRSYTVTAPRRTEYETESLTALPADGIVTVEVEL